MTRQRAVTQDDVTEPPFQHEFWNSKESGHEFDSHSGWPRRHGNSHLSHLFPDGDSE